VSLIIHNVSTINILKGVIKAVVCQALGVVAVSHFYPSVIFASLPLDVAYPANVGSILPCLQKLEKDASYIRRKTH